MSIRIATMRYRFVLLAVTLVITSYAGQGYAASTSTPSALDPLVIQCSMSESICEGDGVTAEVLATNVSNDGEWWWSVVRTSLGPGTVIQPAGELILTRYTVNVEDGTVGLTSDVPLICTGVCSIETGATTATPAGLSPSSILVPVGTEVLLGPGDSVVFEESGESSHVYRNVGSEDARMMSTVFGPTTDAECYGRCLSGF